MLYISSSLEDRLTERTNKKERMETENRNNRPTLVVHFKDYSISDAAPSEFKDFGGCRGDGDK